MYIYIVIGRGDINLLFLARFCYTARLTIITIILPLFGLGR